MRAQLIERVRYCRLHRGGIEISAGEFGPVFEKSLGQGVGSLRERDARAGMGDARRGKPMPDAHRRAISAGMIGRIVTPDTRAKLAAQKGWN